MREITGTVTAWMAPFYGPEDLIGTDAYIIGKLSYANVNLATGGYTKVGSAELRLHLMDDGEVISSKVASLSRRIAWTAL